MIKTYFMLTKPGIIFGNVITAAGGFILASKAQVDPWLFLATLIGLSLLIASACVFNNYIDRNIDKMMERTKNRALARGVISLQKAIIFAVFLGLFGVLVLMLYINLLTTIIALAGFFIYVVLYSLSKHRSSYATAIGSISGGIPPIVGYCAVVNRFDMGAFLLFMIVALWQMPHFFAIAMYRLDDYAAASIPVLPAKRGVYITKVHMLFYIMAFLIPVCMLTLWGYTGYAYLIVVGLLGLIWLFLCIKGFKNTNDRLFGRQMFRFSLVVIMMLCIMICISIA
ncbi:heme o synthase [Candidatus Rhabdochlamydia porcellionis]|jgi:heme o synthase|uniref:Protoheme IX farnesyltransferase n=1 Tax=Candidatus Rhabdochlamydia porcellionis TaxID=225148 RepID=A0ABX8YZH2_9BACT|nr:heme o synthase [Candidatus Rhabdochlamydia porcellionis]QZA58771.1 Protoheme IX farnesyltransferase [Candidatus Rhabdochlamydia porcellionis]